MVNTPLTRIALLGLALGVCGCVTVPDPPLAAQSAPPKVSWRDRILRRSPAIPPSDAVHSELANEARDPGKLSLAYAQLMEEAGNLDAAETHYSRALDEHPDSVDALVGMGRVHESAGRYDAAEQAFHRALKQDPNSAAALHGLGQTCAARQRWDDAAELLNQAVLSDPGNDSFRYDLAVALVQAGNIDAALPHFVRTVGDAEAHYNIGLILQRSGRLPESELQFRTAIAKNPQLDEARYWLDQVQRQQVLPAVPPATAGSGLPVSTPGSIQQIGYQSPEQGRFESPGE
ncbi:MAG: tetratricopeptide repeat protein [Planctomycetaceae bacterium]|nr:tetratricopeptide repeat protein [Planctomycetaceae bacterium]